MGEVLKMSRKICRICLRTEVKMFSLRQYNLKLYYEEVIAFRVNDFDGFPQYFCYECAMLLYKFHKFKEKCFNAIKALKDIVRQNQLTIESVNKIDKERFNIQSLLDIMIITKRVKGCAIQEDIKLENVEEKDNSKEVKPIVIDYIPEDNQDDNLDGFSDPEGINESTIKTEPEDPKPVLVNEKKESVIISRRKHGFIRVKKKILHPNCWKIYILSEEEAVVEFKKRSQTEKYLNTAFPCINCFKGFSKVEMLHRHIQLKHAETIGTNECNFCHMRFKWLCKLRRHMKEHYTKYECLKCGLVCPLEGTAILHDEYHSGVLKKCQHCNEEFRHASTYYTHLRTTHKSEHLCPQCGASFVSKLGLQYHRKQKHLNDEIEGPDNVEDLNTYCETCKIQFKTKKAFEKHIYHSALHEEGMVGDNACLLKKIVQRRDRNRKIINGKSEEDEEMCGESKMMRLRRRRTRMVRKPTTCYQCGKSFNTQARAMKHHNKEHPRTSFHPPNERIICEICGASLAPSSAKAHENSHTKRRMYSCNTCHKSFPAKVTLNRHMLVHTGEKPFKCSLCDKRFTQSNSMKLHYNTFHLKQPYPKRNRTKKKEPPDSAHMEEITREHESDSLLEPDLPISEPDAAMHYLNMQ